MKQKENYTYLLY